MLTFEYKKPEETGVSSKWIKNFLERLDSYNLPMHSFILFKDNAIIAETYYAPYTRDTLHRMFSITKSFVSIAIGLMEKDGLVNLDQPIVSYFPEKVENKDIHPYVKLMTIRDMLKMSSCHSQTTYKALGCTDWVGSFFTTCPNHVPGTTFSYDTSATHTLCALVEKLAGKPMLDYLRDKFLDEIGFSSDAYVLSAPGGESLGGSGLMATPMDLLRFMYVISQNGTINGKELIPSEYVKAATAKQIDTYGKSNTWEEMQGYGYQFWRTTHNGVACYGMGGQYAIYYPDQNMILVTTADTQGRQGGTQLIYDSFYQEIYNKIGQPMDSLDIDFNKYMTNKAMYHLEGASTSTILESINEVRYNLDDNNMGFKWISLSLDKYNGTFDYENATGVHSLSFGIGCNEVSLFPHYNYKTCASGAFKDDNTFLIKANLIDECIGHVFIQLVFKDDYVTLMMRKFEETMFNEFDGFVSGKK